MAKTNFTDALKAMGKGKKVTCTMDDGDPVVYKFVCGDFTVNGKIRDIRDFCFSPSQILWGKWEIEESVNP